MNNSISKTTKAKLAIALCSLSLAFTQQSLAEAQSPSIHNISPALQTTQADAFDTLDINVKALLAEHNLPGLVLMIKHKDKLVHYNAYGKVNVDEPKAMTKDAIFRIYSMSKPVTAFALLQLVDQGKVALDDDIRKFLPEFEPFEAFAAV